MIWCNRGRLPVVRNGLFHIFRAIRRITGVQGRNRRKRQLGLRRPGLHVRGVTANGTQGLPVLGVIPIAR